MRRLLFGLWACAGCATTGLPLDLGPTEAPKAPTHPLRIAVLPLVDGRQGPDGEEPDELYVYRGLTYRATQAGDNGAPTERLTELVARHLAKARVFQQVILVLEEAQAPEADLFLEGRLTRLRGYVEAEAPSKKSGRPQDERQVLAEVLVKGLRVRDREGRVLYDGDVGWSIVEARRLPAEGQLDPWGVLGEALRVGLEAWIAEARQADLSGQVEVQKAVATTTGTVGLTQLGTVLPRGWALTQTSSAATPEGWRGPARCTELKLTQRQTFRFHRALGPYRPTVALWRCPADGPYRFDAQNEFPARYLGTRPSELYFSRAVGESNWKDAEAQLARALALTPPSSRHLFEVGGP